jgi:hypothetical protein
MEIGDKVKIHTNVDDHAGQTGEVVAVWPADGEFQVGVRFPDDAPGESWSYTSEEVEKI